MARPAYYWMTLESLSTPATASEVREHARNIFGSAVKASLHSVRASLDRFVLLGRVTRMEGNKYWITARKFDPIDAAHTEIVRLESQLERAREHLEELYKAKREA